MKTVKPSSKGVTLPLVAFLTVLMGGAVLLVEVHFVLMRATARAHMTQKTEDAELIACVCVVDHRAPCIVAMSKVSYRRQVLAPGIAKPVIAAPLSHYVARCLLNR